MTHKVTFHSEDEETLEIFVDDRSMGSVNHDSVGWDGMSAIKRIATRMAMSLGAEIEETFGGESE